MLVCTYKLIRSKGLLPVEVLQGPQCLEWIEHATFQLYRTDLFLCWGPDCHLLQPAKMSSGNILLNLGTHTGLHSLQASYKSKQAD